MEKGNEKLPLTLAPDTRKKCSSRTDLGQRQISRPGNEGNILSRDWRIKKVFTME